MANSKIRVENLNYNNGSFSLNDISLEFYGGSITGIIGKNGSGKSTLLKLIHGDLKAVSGEVLIEDIPVRNIDSFSLARKISFLYQEMHDPLDFKVGDVMAVSAYTRNSDTEQERRSALGEFGMGKYLNKSFSNLSGGEKRLVTIASSIYQDAEIMIFDEPTAYLDIDNQILVHRLLKHLKDRGKTIIVVMHELNAINAICDSVVMMRNGRIIANGPSGEIMTVENLKSTFNVGFRELLTGSRPFFYTDPGM